MFSALTIFVIFCTTRSSASVSSHQDARLQRTTDAAQCYGQHQSPIHIMSHNLINNDEILVKLNNYNTTVSAKISTDHHSAYFTVDGETSAGLIVSKEEEIKYNLHGFHFHWTCSEHLIDNKRYAVELHFVHYNKLLGSFQEAMRIPGGLSVFAVMFKISDNDDDNEALNIVFDMIKTSRLADQSVSKKSVLHYSDLLPKLNSVLYHYNGSLTTAPCLETVTWNIASEINYLSRQQISDFQSIHKPPITNNCRGLQMQNDRRVYRVKFAVTTDGATTVAIYSKFIPLVFTICFFIQFCL